MLLASFFFICSNTQKNTLLFSLIFYCERKTTIFFNQLCSQIQHSLIPIFALLFSNCILLHWITYIVILFCCYKKCILFFHRYTHASYCSEYCIPLHRRGSHFERDVTSERERKWKKVSYASCFFFFFYKNRGFLSSFVKE